KWIGRAGGLKAALLKAHYALPLGDRPTLKQATDALAWKLLGVDSAQPFTTATVQAVLFNRALGADGPSHSKKALPLLVVRAAGARRDSLDELRRAVLRGWIDRASAEPGPVPSA